MNLQNILQLSGVVAVVLLLLQFFFQVRRIKRGRTAVGHGRVFINWLLVIVILVGFGGGGYLSYKNSHAVAAHPTKTDTQTEESADTVSLDFKKKVYLNSDGKKKVTFTVSPNTKVKIVGHYSKTVYKTLNGKSGSDSVKLHYTFDDSGTYDIIAIKGDQKVVKKLVVKDHKASSDNSSSDTNSSSSSASSSSSSSNSSQSSNNNSSNGGSGSTGGSSSGGGGSSYRGGGGGYTLSRPVPSRPSAPSAPSNGTGAMTGGSY